jgi:hypothetical protein
MDGYSGLQMSMVGIVGGKAEAIDTYHQENISALYARFT